MVRIGDIIPDILLNKLVAYSNRKRHKIRVYWKSSPFTPPTLLVPSYDKIVAQHHSVIFNRQIELRTPHSIRDRANALVGRPAGKVTIEADVQGGLDKDTAKRVLEWMDAAFDTPAEDRHRIQLPLDVGDTLVEAYKQKRVADALLVTPLMYMLDNHIDGCLRNIGTVAVIRAVITTFGPESREGEAVSANAANALLHQHQLETEQERTYATGLMTLLDDEGVPGTAVKAMVGCLVMEIELDHPYGQFETSERYKELWDNSPVFKRAIEGGWKDVV